MLLVIFGAGASFDAIPYGATDVHPLGEFRFPLANDLFQARPAFRTVLGNYPEIAAALPLLIDIEQGESIEDVLERMQEQARNADPTRARQLLAIQFYIRDVIQRCEAELGRTYGLTNHATLFDEIHRHRPIGEDIFLVTFNYDRLIEKTLETRFGPFDSMNRYVQTERFKLIKLHGSVDWVRPLAVNPILVDGTFSRRQLIELAPTISLSDQFIHTSNRHNGELCLPAIAIPIKQKEQFQCPVHHVEALAGFLPQVTKVLMVGWKGAEKPFLDLLVKHLPRKSVLNQNPKIAIVGGQDVAQTRKNLENAGIFSKYIEKDIGFTAFAKSMLRDPWFEKFLKE